MIRWYKEIYYKEIRKKAPDLLKKSGKAFFLRVKDKDKMEGNNFYIDGPCKSTYNYNYDSNGHKLFNFKIVWLSTLEEDTNIALYDDNEIYKPMRKNIILIDSENIIMNDNSFTNLPVCKIIENGKILNECMSFEIQGPSRVIYNSQRKGIFKTWIETDSEIKVID